MLAKRYELLGKEELDWVCEFCGKKEISLCYTVKDLDTGDIRRFGSVCIRKALGVTSKEIKEEIKANIEAIKAEYNPRINELLDKSYKLGDEWRKANDKVVGFPPEDSEAGKLFDEGMKLRKEMNSKIKMFE